jgi:hypothetical protein
MWWYQACARGFFTHHANKVIQIIHHIASYIQSFKRFQKKEPEYTCINHGLLLHIGFQQHIPPNLHGNGFDRTGDNKSQKSDESICFMAD